MKKKTKKMIKALKYKINKVDARARLVTDCLNYMYEAQTKWFISKWGSELVNSFIKNI